MMNRQKEGKKKKGTRKRKEKKGEEKCRPSEEGGVDLSKAVQRKKGRGVVSHEEKKEEGGFFASFRGA